MSIINKQLLAERIDQAFNNTELKTDLCFPLGIEWDDIKGKNKKDTIIELITYADRRTRLQNLIEQCRKVRPNEDWSKIGPPSILRVPFTNRTNELKNLVYPITSSQYSIVHAPSGYGKSRLLEQCADRFWEEKWVYGYAQVNKNATQIMIAQLLGNFLTMPLLDEKGGGEESVNNNESAGEKLGNAIDKGLA